MVGFRVGCESALSQAAAPAPQSAGPLVLAQPVGPQPCNGRFSQASPAAPCGNPGAGQSQSKGASPQPHTFTCSYAAKPSQPRKMAGCVDDAGSRQGEGDGDLSHPLRRGPSNRGAGTASHCRAKNFPSQSQEEARKEFCPETSVPGTVFLFVFTFILSRVSQSSGSREQSQTQS